jgi:hypothetical protein
MQAIHYSSYKAYTTARAQQGLQVIPERLFDALTAEEKMHNQFKADMKSFIALDENKDADGGINWNFIDSDMFAKWSVLLDGDHYTSWFEHAADEIEGAMV